MYHNPIDLINLINVMHDKAVLLQRQTDDTPSVTQDSHIIENLILDIKMMARQIIYDGDEPASYKKFDKIRIS